MSRAISGKVPRMISMTLPSWSTPKTIKRIGRMASGGMLATKVRKGSDNPRMPGSSPMLRPRKKPITAATVTPRLKRFRLAAVSCQRRILPLRPSGIKATFSTA
ncbi:MAG: hypothetical protein ACD_75C01570G0001 [uncultured bacterium]|nr:MAG: hypothetical protein ACD_75C01570G0001 [uncultured bacterium]